MASHFYRLRMGAYAETLFRCNKREKLQMIWLQCNLMRLGNEVIRSEHWSIAADQPVRHEHGAVKIASSGEMGETATPPCPPTQNDHAEICNANGCVVPVLLS